MKRSIFAYFIFSLFFGSSGFAQVTKPVGTPNLHQSGELPASGNWSCMTTCGGPARDHAKIKEAQNQSPKNCSGKGKTVEEAMSELKTKLERDASQGSTHEPNYECKGCAKGDLENTVCKDGHGSSAPYHDLVKSKAR